MTSSADNGVVVPREPTAEMLRAGDLMADFPSGYSLEARLSCLRGVWLGMLAAAPASDHIGEPNEMIAREAPEGGEGAVPIIEGVRDALNALSCKTEYDARNRKYFAAGRDDLTRALALLSAPAPAKGEGAVPGWMSRAVYPFMQEWGGHGIRGAVSEGVPNEAHCSPRLGVHQYMDHAGNLTIGLMVGNDHSKGGVWVEQDFTPEQCVRIIASILSKPAMEPVVGALLSAVTHPAPSLSREEIERNAAAYELVKEIGRLTHTGDEDWCGQGDDPDEDHYALMGLIAKARDIMAMPLRQILGDALLSSHKGAGG